MPRPDRLVLVTGTGTDVGKTWAGAALARALRARGLSVAVRKPVQSFVAGDDATDADVLAAATGETPTGVCPAHRWFDVAMAPPMAARVLARPPFTIADLAAELAWPARADVGVVEGAGGARSPLAEDGDTVAFGRSIGPDVVLLVADAGLGTINAVRLSADALDGVAPATIVFLNRFDGSDALHVANRDWLVERDGFDVVTDVGQLAAQVAAGLRPTA